MTQFRFPCKRVDLYRALCLIKIIETRDDFRLSLHIFSQLPCLCWQFLLEIKNYIYIFDRRNSKNILKFRDCLYLKSCVGNTC